MKRNVSIGLLTIFLIAFMVPASLAVPPCDKAAPDDIYPAEFLPSIESANMMGAVLGFLGTITIKGPLAFGPTDIEDVIAQLVGDDRGFFDLLLLAFGGVLQREHLMTVHMEDLDLNLSSQTVMATPSMGSLEVKINIPSFDEHMLIEIDNTYTCALYQPFCIAENFMFAIMNGLNFTMDIDPIESYIRQVADVCVTPACVAAHPLSINDTRMAVFGIHMILIEPGDLPVLFNGLWRTLANFTNGLISTFAMVFMNNYIEGKVEDMVLIPDSDPQEGLLISLFSGDIRNDGCKPTQAVVDCKGGAGCSSVSLSHNLIKSVNVLFYALPIAILFGLLVWRRKVSK